MWIFLGSHSERTNMTTLQRTNLSVPEKVDLAASFLALSGNYGEVTSLSKRFDVSRPTVYAAGESAALVLEDYFERDFRQSGGHWVWVDDAQMNRAIVALRVGSPTGIRPIEDLLPILYPGISTPSYGTIQAVLVEAEEKSALFSRGVALSNLTNAALDEMFSQGDPVLAGVDLVSGYLFLLSLESSRKSDDWERVLTSGRDQGLDLKVVVKDAARGIASGVKAVFPEAEQRDDCFHAVYAMGKVRRILERRALSAIAREIEAENKGSSDLDQKKAQSQAAMELHDSFERAMKDAQESMEFIDLASGQLRTSSEILNGIDAASAKIIAISDSGCVKVGTYIKNRALGLSRYMDELNQKFSLLGNQFGRSAVLLSATIWRLAFDLEKNQRPWLRTNYEKRLMEAYHELHHIAGEKRDEVLISVRRILDNRFRASSAIEGFNAALRPHLYVHKGVSQGFLNLFQAYFNLRTRRWGRHKGTSAYEVMTGKKVDDWLSLLGYPPSKSPQLRVVC